MKCMTTTTNGTTATIMFEDIQYHPVREEWLLVTNNVHYFGFMGTLGKYGILIESCAICATPELFSCNVDFLNRDSRPKKFYNDIIFRCTTSTELVTDQKKLLAYKLKYDSEIPDFSDPYYITDFIEKNTYPPFLTREEMLFQLTLGLKEYSYI